MSHDAIGQTCALLAAFTWASALVMFKRSGELVEPLSLNLFKNVVALICFGATLVAVPLVSRVLPGIEQVSVIPDLTDGDVQFDAVILAVSGILGIAMADTIFFYGLNLIGVGLITIVDCSYAPFMVLFSAVLLFEELTLFEYLGIALIVSAVLLVAGAKPPENRTRGQLVLGVLCGLAAIALMAFGIVMAKPVLEQYSVIWATLVRLLAGTLVLALFVSVGPGRVKSWSVFKPDRVWRVMIPASIAGTYLALVFWVAGFKYTKASVAAILNQTSVIFAMILAAVYLKEPMTPRKIAAVVLALAGVVVMTAFQ
jgi:drug/metabolite transporter (DMT)-like permease